MKISVIDGDITAVPAQALITAINSSGMWFGGIDGVIMRAAGDQFHAQAADALRIDRSVKAVVAKQRGWHYGNFVDVVFVIDDLEEPLNVIVRRSLTVAGDAGYHIVSMPLIRFGVMRDVGGTSESKLRDIVMAIEGAQNDVKNRIEKLSVVVYGDLALSAQLRGLLER